MKLSTVKIFLIAAIICLSSACSILNPFIDRRREPGGIDMKKLYVGESTPTDPAICYNPLVTDVEKVEQIATDECVRYQTGNKAEFVKKTTFTCRVLIPNHSYYKCITE